MRAPHEPNVGRFLTCSDFDCNGVENLGLASRYSARAMTAEPARAVDKFDHDALELGRRIRTLRLERKLTLQTVAGMARVSQSLISQVERGLASPSINTLRRVAGALDVPIA